MVYKKEISIKYEADVFIAGGGPAGVAAAISAARQGKTVYLAEINGCFGGLGTTGLVPTFTQFTDGQRFLVGGVGREIRDLSIGSECDYKRGFYPFNVEKLKKIYDSLITAEKNIKFSFFTRLIDVVATDGHVEYVLLAAKSGVFAAKAKIYIDCTGDGDLCAWAGADYEYGNEEGEVMPSTLCSLWANIDFNQPRPRIKDIIEQAISDGVFSNEDRHVPGIFTKDAKHGIGGGNVGHVFGVNGTDETSLTKAMIDGRKVVEEFEYFYKHYVPGYENAYLSYTADMLGIRESRRIVGDYRITGQDFRERRVFDDMIGRYAYPVDIHIMKPTKQAFDEYEKEFLNDMRYEVGESYSIPYRILTPKKLSNVLVAGRCVSSDRQMQASVRVMPCCFITGQAAGIAATLACEQEDIRAVNIPQLQNSIVAAGGVIF